MKDVFQDLGGKKLSETPCSPQKRAKGLSGREGKRCYGKLEVITLVAVSNIYLNTCQQRCFKVGLTSVC